MKVDFFRKLAQRDKTRTPTSKQLTNFVQNTRIII